MPRYQVTLDGKTFVLEGDHPPSEDEARQAISGHAAAAPAQQSAQPAPSFADSLLEDNPALPPMIRAGQGALRMAKAHPVETGALVGGAALAPLTGGLSVPAALGAVGVGAAGGAGYGLMAKGAQTGDFGTPEGNAATMATEGALSAGGEGVGRLAEKGLTKAAYRIYRGILRPSGPLQREFGDIAATGIREGIPVSDQGALTAAAERGKSAATARDLVQQAAPTAPNVRTVTEVGREVQPIVQRATLRASTGLPNESSAIVSRIKDTQQSYPGGIPLERAQALKDELQDLAANVYRAQDKGAAVVDLGADTNAAMARGLRGAIETRVPGVGPTNARTQDLIGLSHAMENANHRNISIGLKSLIGDVTPGLLSGGAIGADRIAPIMPSLFRAVLASLGGGS